MDLLLLPKASGNELKEVYHRALRVSVELYIVNAYLTHWEVTEKLGTQCESFLFIIGKDFGITRKAACRGVLEWLPKSRLGQFIVADSINGFHPKAIFWKEKDGTFHALVGSSNLSRAAFSSNYEANGYSRIDKETFVAARAWVKGMEEYCVGVGGWLDHYQEAVQPKKMPKHGQAQREDYVLDLTLPDPNRITTLRGNLKYRREQMRIFTRQKGQLEALFRVAAKARIWNSERNLAFYEDLNRLWSFSLNGYRFQGPGWERKGKDSNFRELSKSLVRVLDTHVDAQDEVVTREIDNLKKLKVSTRGALFSEILCQFFPKKYHIINKPVSLWLAGTGVKPPRGSSEGVAYIYSARLLRAALRRTRGYEAKNLAELDVIIWLSGEQAKS
jgi:hypothetical protein